MLDFSKIKRIDVIGPSGSGKSYLSKELGRRLGLPIYHIDLHFWKRGWKKPDSKEKWLKEIKRETEKDEWIIDGTYNDTLEDRFKRSDLVVYLNLPTEFCVESAIKRHTLTRDDFPKYLQNHLPEDLDRLLDIINSWYAKNEKEIEDLLDNHAGDKTLRFFTRSEIDNFIASVPIFVRTK